LLLEVVLGAAIEDLEAVVVQVDYLLGMQVLHLVLLTL
jgi:hypothetical protein